MLFLRKEMSPYLWVLNKYEEYTNEQLSLLILMIFVKISRIIFKELNVLVQLSELNYIFNFLK
jgi:hypothetical protein